MCKKSDFFDRKTILDILNKRLTGLKEGYRQNITLIGNLSIGKTSIIEKFLSTFEDNQVICVYLSLEGENLASFTNKFIGTFLYSFLRNSGLTLKEDTVYLQELAGKFIPQTIEKIKRISANLEKRKTSDIFIDLLKITDLVNYETGKFCLVILDEFHNLDSLCIHNLYKEWAKLIMLQKNTMYLITSSAKYKAKGILAESLSLLFGNFEVIDVEPFDLKTSSEFIEERTKPLNIEYNFKNFLIHLTGGHPYYLDVISQTFPGLSKLNDNNISLEHLVSLLRSILFEPPGILNQIFNTYLKNLSNIRFAQDYVSILFSIASGHNKIRDIACNLRKQKKEINLRTSYLLETDMILKNGEFFRINDRLFSFWLKVVYEKRLNSFNLDKKTQLEFFTSTIEKTLKEFISASERNTSDRVLELFRLFGNEAVQIERHRVKLTHFKEVKSLKFNAARIKDGIIGRTEDILWIAALKEDVITVDDLVDFCTECKKHKRDKLQRKIIIAFKEIDTNVRLKALEEKIWTWSIENLNSLLDLYGKPRIIK